MEAVAGAAQPLAGDALRRADAALVARRRGAAIELVEARATFAAMLADTRSATS
jgi:hypothetical protein